MGASVSLPGPFAQFSRLSLSDVDEMIIRHRTQLDGAFMVTPQELEAIVGPKVKDAAAICLLYTSPSPRDRTRSRMPSSA